MPFDVTVGANILSTLLWPLVNKHYMLYGPDVFDVLRIEQWSSTWGKSNRGGKRRHLTGYAKTADGVCKIEKKY
jgi:hypothetical protein